MNSAPRTAPAPGTGPSRERELRFHVPARAREGLALELAAGGREVPLHAVYFDTVDRLLQQGGMTLRVRREAGRWVQTFKAPGSHAWERIEDNVRLRAADGDAPPLADPARHREPSVRQALRQALGSGSTKAALQPAFEVVVRRQLREVRLGSSLVEVAFDQGELLAAGRTRPIRELELELVEGGEADLFELARQWCGRWGLALQVASKAERGFLLSAGERWGAAVGSQAVHAGRKPVAGDYAAAVLESCLRQVAANADWVAAGSRSDEHVHQLRVGLRRLRTALRELPGLASARKLHEPVLADASRRLGERRDRTHVLRKIAPLVQAAGGPPLHLPPGFDEGPDPPSVVRRPGFQDALLDLLLRTHELRERGGRGLRRSMRPRLDKLHRAVVDDGRLFTDLPQGRQHRVRKRLKRLRYLSEFLGPVFGDATVRRYLDALKPSQEALGSYNDEVTARLLYEELAATDPGARFGAGWLRDREAGHAKAIGKALRKLEKAEPFWRNG